MGRGWWATATALVAAATDGGVDVAAAVHGAAARIRGKLGDVTAALHRGWIALKDALTGDDPGSVLGACVTGENHAVSEYEKALEQDLSAGFREVVTRQHAAVLAARDEVKALQSAS